MMKLAPLALLLVCAARLAYAHSEPIDPSVCTLSPFEISAPGAGRAGSADAPGPADVLRQVYDPETSTVTFCPADAATPTTKCATAVAPRGFTMGNVSGTLAFPLSFPVAMLATGDLTATALPLTIDIGDGPVVVPFLFTTGLASSAGGSLLEGAAIDAAGAVSFVGTGTGTGLAAPLADQQLIIRASCTLAPPPDLDQFSLTPTITRVSGRIAATGVRVKVAVALQPGQVADFATKASMLRLSTGDTVLADVNIPSGLTGTKRTLHGTGPAGAAVTIHVRAAKRYVLDATIAAGTLPPNAAGKIDVDVAQNVGGLFSRATRSFRANRTGTVLRAK